MTYYHRLDNVPAHDFPFGKMQVLSGATNMVFWAKIDGGSHVERHNHPNEQITWVRKGRVDYRIDDGEIEVCEAGSLITIPANVFHESWYVEDCEIVEFFSPPRLDIFPGAATNPYGVE